MRHALFIPVALALGAVGLAACGQGHAGHGANTPVADGAREVRVRAGNLSFDPGAITVAVDEDIVVVLTSEDGEHDFTVDELDAHVVAGPGDTARGGFRATESGRYEFYCSVPGHRDGGMEGVVVVQ